MASYYLAPTVLDRVSTICVFKNIFGLLHKINDVGLLGVYKRLDCLLSVCNRCGDREHPILWGAYGGR